MFALKFFQLGGSNNLPFVSVRVVQRNRTNRRLGYIYIYKWDLLWRIWDLLWRIDSDGYRGWRVLQSATCKLEIKENQWCGASSYLKALKQTPSGVISSPREGENQCLSVRQREFSFPPHFCSIWALCELDDAHSHQGGPSAVLRPPIQVLISSSTPL